MTRSKLDPETVARAAAGDRDALEQALRALEPELRREISIQPLWQRSLDADDVLQVSFLEAYLRIGSLRDASPAGLRAWMRRLVRNNLIDAVRELERDRRPDARRRVTRGAEGQSARTLLQRIAGERPSAGSQISWREQVGLLSAAIEQLPPSYRLIVEEADLAERPVAEVAARMGRSPGAVHLLRKRAHDRLRELMGDERGA